MGNLNETNDKDEDRNTAKDYFVYIFLEIGKEFSSQFESGQHSIRSTMTGGPKSETETAVNSGDISTECKRRQRVGARARCRFYRPDFRLSSSRFLTGRGLPMHSARILAVATPRHCLDRLPGITPN